MKFEGLTYAEQELTSQWYDSLSPEDQVNVESFIESIKTDHTGLYIVGSSVTDFLTNKLLNETQEFSKKSIPIITPELIIDPSAITTMKYSLFKPTSIQEGRETLNPVEQLLSDNLTLTYYAPRTAANQLIRQTVQSVVSELIFPENQYGSIDVNAPIVQYVERRSNESFMDFASMSTEELRALSELFISNKRRSHEPSILHNILLTMDSMSDEEYQELKILEPVLNQPISSVTSAYSPRKALDFLVKEALKGLEPVESDIDVVLIQPTISNMNIIYLTKKFEDFNVKFSGTEHYAGFDDIRFTLTPMQGKTLDLLFEKKPNASNYYTSCYNYEKNHDMSERLVLYRGDKSILAMINVFINDKMYKQARDLAAIPGEVQTSIKTKIFKQLVPTLMNYNSISALDEQLFEANYKLKKVDQQLLNSCKNEGPLTEASFELAVELASIYPQITENGLGNKLKSLVSAEVWEQFRTRLDNKLSIEKKEYKIML